VDLDYQIFHMKHVTCCRNVDIHGTIILVTCFPFKDNLNMMTLASVYDLL